MSTVSHTTPTRSDSVVERAKAAARQARAADPHIAQRVPDHSRTAYRRRIARAFADNYGLDPSDVIVTDDPNRTYGTWRGVLITITDADRSFAFIPAFGSEEVFVIVGPCPGCFGDVPLADASDLAAFGIYLDTADDGDGPRPPEFRHDPGHAPTCRHH